MQLFKGLIKLNFEDGWSLPISLVQFFPKFIPTSLRTTPILLRHYHLLLEAFGCLPSRHGSSSLFPVDIHRFNIYLSRF
jgi:hypothetical protein